MSKQLKQKYSLDSKSILISCCSCSCCCCCSCSCVAFLIWYLTVQRCFSQCGSFTLRFSSCWYFFVSRVSWLVSPLVGNIILVIAIILSIFAFARWWKLMVKWRSSMISWDPLSLPSIINFGEALLLNKLSYTPRIGRILKSKDNSLKWDQSEICNFIRLEAVLLWSWCLFYGAEDSFIWVGNWKIEFL